MSSETSKPYDFSPLPAEVSDMRVPTPALFEQVSCLVDAVINNSATAQDIWKVHAYRRSKTNQAESTTDAAKVAEIYQDFGVTAGDSCRITADYLAQPSLTGASNLRINIDTTPGPGLLPARHQYTLTTYAKSVSPRGLASPELFDEQEYERERVRLREFLAAGGSLEAWEAQEEASAVLSSQTADQLPPILYKNVKSQFLCRPGLTGPTIHMATFDPRFGNRELGCVDELLARRITSIDASPAVLENAYAPPRLPALTPNQDMVRKFLGAEALVRYMLSQALQSLAQTGQ